MAQVETQRPSIQPFLPVGGPQLSGEMKACAEACRRCAESCRKMSAMA